MKEAKTYTIQEVSNTYDITVEALRYYEKSEVLFPIERKPNGHRVFNEWDVEWIYFIKLLKSTGMPLSGIKEYKKLVEKGDKTNIKRRDLMIKHRETILNKMENLKDYLVKIDYKIKYYDTLINR